MKRSIGPFLALCAFASCAASTSAVADNLLGFYIGAGVGESQIRSDDPAYGYPAYYNDYETAWKGIIGFRPIRWFGVEAEYIDFGQPGNYNGYNNVNYYGNDSHPTAAEVLGVAYLPIPIPFIDIFAKAGGARLKTNVNIATCNAGSFCDSGNYPYPTVVRTSVTNTKFAYGGGVQSKLPFGLTLRAEYERVSSSYGDPDALMVSAIWTF